MKILGKRCKAGNLILVNLINASDKHRKELKEHIRKGNLTPVNIDRFNLSQLDRLSIQLGDMLLVRGYYEVTRG